MEEGHLPVPSASAITVDTMNHTRPVSNRYSIEIASESDDSVSSPERALDDDTDFFMLQTNDSQSSLGVTNLREMSMSVDLERERRISPISKLPPELLLTILAKLTSTVDLRNCMLVSYHWAAHTVGILWHRPLCNKWTNLLGVVCSLSTTNGFFPYHDLVRRLNLSALSEKISDGTVQPFMNCKRIERLTLTNCSKLTDQGVSNLVEGNRHLQALDVTDLDSLTDHTLFAVAENCPRLQGLNVTNCVNITDKSLVKVSENCRQIKRLKLNNLPQTTDHSIISFAANCRSILEIDLHSCSLITSSSVTALLAGLANLRELRLAHCTQASDNAFLDLPPRMMFDSLRILDLTACEEVRDDAINRIIPATPRLRNLVLAKCKNITDRAVLSICRLGKNLHYIHLGHCTNLTDAAVVALVRACNRIRYIDLACCYRLTDVSVTFLAQLPKLRRVGLVKCQQLTDRSIKALARGPNMQSSSGKMGAPPICSLERVHLSYCIHLTLSGIHCLLYHCPRLTHLSLTGVSAFLREDLTRFCRDAPPEFTHPQRDVFCVFSGEGVGRLREYLTRLAREAAERDGREHAEENVFEGDESAGGDTISDDGTIGEEGSENPMVNRANRGLSIMSAPDPVRYDLLIPPPPPLQGMTTLSERTTGVEPGLMYHHDPDQDVFDEGDGDDERDGVGISRVSANADFFPPRRSSLFAYSSTLFSSGASNREMVEQRRRSLFGTGGPRFHGFGQSLPTFGGSSSGAESSRIADEERRAVMRQMLMAEMAAQQQTESLRDMQTENDGLRHHEAIEGHHHAIEDWEHFTGRRGQGPGGNGLGNSSQEGSGNMMR